MNWHKEEIRHHSLDFGGNLFPIHLVKTFKYTIKVEVILLVEYFEFKF